MKVFPCFPTGSSRRPDRIMARHLWRTTDSMKSHATAGHDGPPQNDSLPKRGLLFSVLGLILVTAALLRFPMTDRIPPGLWFDEALNGQDACAVWGMTSIGSDQEPGFRLVYTNVFPREPLFETLLAISIKVLGPSVETLRLVPASIGLLTVLLLFLMLRLETGAATALTAAAILATMRWHVIFSRLVFRTIILGPWLIGIVWIALSYRRKPSVTKATLLGIMIGAGFYTYLAWYLMLPLVAGIILWLSLHSRGTPRAWPQVTMMILAMLICAAPIGMHYLENPASLLARPGEISVFKPDKGEDRSHFNSGLQEIIENVGEALLMFHWRGDHVAKQNIVTHAHDQPKPHGAPALDKLHGLMMLVGLWFCIMTLMGRRQSWIPLHSKALPAIQLGWLACGMLPTILARTDSPNFLRTLCLTPAVATICAVGLVGMVGSLSGSRGRKIAPVLAVLLLIVSGINCAHQIYKNWPGDISVWKGFNGDITQIGYYSAAMDDGSVEVMVPQLLYKHRTFQFLNLGQNHARPYHNWKSMLGKTDDDPPGQRAIIVTVRNGVLNPLQDLLPSAKVDQHFAAPHGRTWALAFIIDKDKLPSPHMLEEMDRKWLRPMGY